MNDFCQVDVSALSDFDLVVARFDRQGVLRYLNLAGQDLLGTEGAGEVSLADLFPDAAERDRMLLRLGERLQRKADVYRTVFQPLGTRAGDPPIPVSVYAMPEANTDGEIIGSFALVRDLREEHARSAIHRAIETATTVQGLFEGVSAALRPLLAFDDFRVTSISKSRQHLRTMYSMDAAAARQYRHRWWPMPPFILATFEDEIPQVIESSTLLADPNYAALLERDEATRTYFSSGVVQILSLPVVAGNRIVAFVGLESRRDGAFDSRSLALVQRLPLTDAVTAALHLEERDRQQTVFELIRQMNQQSSDVRSLALAVVQKLADCFGWEHVSIFKNDERRDQVRLVCQSTRPGFELDPKFALPRRRPSPGGSEPNGAIASAALSGQIVNVSDTGTARSTDYVRGVKDISSELAIPVPGEPVRWILNVESKMTNAFAAEEIELLELLAAEAGSVLQRSALFEMQTAVLRTINDAVLETDLDGRIRWCNAAAERLLGGGEVELTGLSVTDLIDDADLGAALATTSSFTHRQTVLRSSTGRRLPALLSGSTLPEHLDGRAYVLSDLSFQEELQRLGELKEVFRHAAMEGRVPLALAATWLEQCGHLLPEGMAAKILRQLGRADLPLERLMRLSAADDSRPSDCTADLRRAVEVTLAELPDTLREAVDVDMAGESLRVNCGFDDLQFCVESLLTFALRTRPQSRQLRVAASRSTDCAVLSILGAWAPDLLSEREPGPSERWRRKSLRDLTMGESVVDGIVRGAGGRYHSRLEGQLALEITLPLQDAEARSAESIA